MMLSIAWTVSVVAALSGGASRPAMLPSIDPDSPGSDFLLIDNQLNATPVRLVSVSGDSVTYITTGKDPHTTPLAQVTAMAPAWWTPSADTPVTPTSLAAEHREESQGPASGIELVDGRRFTGQFAGGSGADRLTWKHDTLGVMSFSLDEVRWIELAEVAAGAPAGQPTAKPKQKSDRVVMRNGDVVFGFIDSLSAGVSIEVDGRKTTLEEDSVARIEFANPPKAGKGARVWLSDGTVAGIVRLETSADGSILAVMSTDAKDGEATRSRIPIGDLVAFMPEVARAIPLSASAISAQRPGPDRRRAEPVIASWRDNPIGDQLWTGETGSDPVPLGAPDLRIPGPMSVDWVLPAGASRVAGWAQVPVSCRVWADCVLVISLVGPDGAGVELHRTEMNGQSPIAEFNIKLDPRQGPSSLRVTVLEGSHGPVQDQIELHRALIQVVPAKQ